MTATTHDFQTWIDILEQDGTFILKRTLRDLSRIDRDADQPDVAAVVGILEQDPLMTIILLRFLQRNRRHSQLDDVVQVDQALMMIGMRTFFTRVMDGLQTAEDQLKQNLPALTGMLHTVKRATRAASYARDWAIRQKDLGFELIRITALLHNFAEILLWLHAPDQMAEVHRLQLLDRTRRTRDVQTEVLGFKVSDLQLELARRWNLPELLVHFMERNYTQQRRIQTVVLAVNLARHSENGWNDAALPDDYREIGELLHMTPDDVMMLVQGDQVSTGAGIM